MPRAIWKRAISFGLVHVPVALYPASEEAEIDFDWLGRRTMDPVGYKRTNKRTGKEIDKDNIVKGVKQENGDCVLLSEDGIKVAYPKTTQTIEIEAFVPATDISFVYLQRPYYLEPVGRAQKHMPFLLERIAKSELNPDVIISHRMQLADAARAYEIFNKKQEDCRKVVLVPH